MNVIVSPALALDEFLSWEREQPFRYEFDGIQPIQMTGGTVAHARLIKRLMLALADLPTGYEAFPGDLKVVTAGRVRYPDALILRGVADPKADRVLPVVVFEVLSESTALTDLRVKPGEYAAVPSIESYVILSQDAPEVVVLRRSTGWQPETVTSVLALTEPAVLIKLGALYPT